MFRECFFLVTLPLKTAKFFVTLLYRAVVVASTCRDVPTPKRFTPVGKLRLDQLNDPELLQVMSYLSPSDMLNFGLVCQRFLNLFQTKMRSNQSIRNVNKSISSSSICSSLFNEYKSMFRSNIDVSLNYGKFLNVLILYMPRVKHIWLDGCYGINDRNLYLLGDYMPCLTSLWLFNANVSDAGLERFFRFAPNLEKLALKSVECRGSCFNSIGNRVKSLIFLLCWGPEMSGYQILANKISNTLEELTIVNKGINGDEIAQCE
ncbi:hypothetical protein B4U80_14185 [Leptotrombidium deliense]|uniref:F-box domain-containing protein n=1 Tax=Leptotrombidium deliense TaxID=299467 RepID=A0A443S0N4_9ACAR|nr:hypothetical protein B4U80_14185 [Leptotrombidium deliense]